MYSGGEALSRPPLLPPIFFKRKELNLRARWLISETYKFWKIVYEKLSMKIFEKKIESYFVL